GFAAARCGKAAAFRCKVGLELVKAMPRLLILRGSHPMLIEVKASGGKPPSRLRHSAVCTFILTIFLLIGLAGRPVYSQESSATRGRRASNTPAAEATVTVNEQFLNSFLTAIFDNLNEPSMPLTIGGATSTAQF